jgi:hypothetical protein
VSAPLGRLAASCHLRLLREETDAARALLPSGVGARTLDKAEILSGGVAGVVDHLAADGLEAVCLSLAGVRHDLARLIETLRAARALARGGA